MAAPKLSHTIQTTVGMVDYGGAAMQRRYYRWLSGFYQRVENSLICIVKGRAPAWSSENATYEFFIRCVLENRIPNFVEHHSDYAVIRLRCNILASRNVDVGLDFIKQTIVSRKRLDLEQAAAVIFSAIVNDDTIKLREEIVGSLITSIDHKTLVKSCMWMKPIDKSQPENSKLSRLVDLADRIISKQDISICKTPEMGIPTSKPSPYSPQPPF